MPRLPISDEEGRGIRRRNKQGGKMIILAKIALLLVAIACGIECGGHFACDNDISSECGIWPILAIAFGLIAIFL
jgi:hypothetical protein